MVSKRILITFALLGALSSQQSFGMLQAREKIDGKTVLFYKNVDKNPLRTNSDGAVLSSPEALRNESGKQWPETQEGYLYYNVDRGTYISLNNRQMNPYTPERQNIYTQQTPTTSTYQQTPIYTVNTQSNLTSSGYQYQQPTQYSAYQQATAPLGTNNTGQRYQVTQQESPSINVEQPQDINQQTARAQQALNKDMQQLTQNYNQFKQIIEKVKEDNNDASEEDLGIKIQQALWTNRKNINFETYIYHLYTKIMEDEKQELYTNPNNFVAFTNYLTINGGLPTINQADIDGALTFVKNTAKNKQLSYWQMAQFMVPSIVSAAVSGAGKGLVGGVAIATAAAGANKEGLKAWLPAAVGAGALGATTGLFTGAVAGYNQVKQLSANIEGQNKNNPAQATRRKESTWNWVMRQIGLQRTKRNRF